jgi:hypothetical protein
MQESRTASVEDGSSTFTAWSVPRHGYQVVRGSFPGEVAKGDDRANHTPDRKLQQVAAVEAVAPQRWHDGSLERLVEWLDGKDAGEDV